MGKSSAGDPHRNTNKRSGDQGIKRIALSDRRSLGAIPIRMRKTPDSCSEGHDVEVHDQTGWAIGEFQVRYALSEMNGMYRFDRFQLDDHCAFHQEVDLQSAVDRRTLVFQLYAQLCLESQLSTFQLKSQAFSVYGLEQPRPAFAMSSIPHPMILSVSRSVCSSVSVISRL